MLVPLAGLSVWVRNLVLDTDNYVDTVAPLARNKAITDQVANRLTTRLFQESTSKRKQRTRSRSGAQFLAGPISTGRRDLRARSRDARARDRTIRDIWKNANRRAHTLVDKALTGEGKNVTIKNGKVVLDLSAVIDEVVKRLDERGVTVFDSLAQKQKNLQVELFDASQLEKARSGRAPPRPGAHRAGRPSSSSSSASRWFFRATAGAR